jgi:hypothetical protein
VSFSTLESTISANLSGENPGKQKESRADHQIGTALQADLSGSYPLYSLVSR